MYQILQQVVVDDKGNAADQKFKSRRLVVITPDFSMNLNGSSNSKEGHK